MLSIIYDQFSLSGRHTRDGRESEKVIPAFSRASPALASEGSSNKNCHHSRSLASGRPPPTPHMIESSIEMFLFMVDRLIPNGRSPYLQLTRCNTSYWLPSTLFADIAPSWPARICLFGRLARWPPGRGRLVVGWLAGWLGRLATATLHRPAGFRSLAL